MPVFTFVWLQEMVKNYESTNDKWRAFGYQKAIAALKRFPKEITSWEVCCPHIVHGLMSVSVSIWCIV